MIFLNLFTAGGWGLSRGTLLRWQRRSNKYDDSHIDICQVRSSHRLVTYYKDPRVPILPGQVSSSQSVIVYNNDTKGTTMSGQNTYRTSHNDNL